MNRRTIPLGVLLVLGCTSGLTDPSADVDATALTVTDLAEYEGPDSSRSTMVRFVFSNRTHATVWIVRCGDPLPDLEMLVDGVWMLAAGGPGLECLLAHRVEAGTQLRGELRISARSLEDREGPGTYRLVWPDAVWNFDSGRPPFGDLLPHEYRVSNRFELR